MASFNIKFLKINSIRSFFNLICYNYYGDNMIERDYVIKNLKLNKDEKAYIIKNNKLSDTDTIYIIKNDTLNNTEKDYEISNKRVNIQRIFVDSEEDSGSVNTKVSEEILYNKVKPKKFMFEDELELENRKVR